MSRTQIWSFGGGVQTTAIAALIVQGKLPKPDVAVFADTGREKGSTLEYLNAYTGPQLAQVGVTVTIVQRAEYGSYDLFDAKGKYTLLPGFTTQNGEPGRKPTFCSTNWKRDVIRRYLREQGIASGDMWMGISCDELQRLRYDDPSEKFQRTYPLIDLRLRRGDCVNLVERMGWPTPPRSSCYMCPNMHDREWRELKETRPAEFAAACAVEAEIRAKDAHFYLHKSCKPLAEVDFSDQPGLFDESCKTGFCFT